MDIAECHTRVAWHAKKEHISPFNSFFLDGSQNHVKSQNISTKSQQQIHSYYNKPYDKSLSQNFIKWVKTLAFVVVGIVT